MRSEVAIVVTEGLEAREDDLMIVHISVNYPDWMDELDAKGFHNVLTSARHKATDTFLKELDKAEAFWKERKKQATEGQTDIYDYV